MVAPEDDVHASALKREANTSLHNKPLLSLKVVGSTQTAARSQAQGLGANSMDTFLTAGDREQKMPGLHLSKSKMEE